MREPGADIPIDARALEIAQKKMPALGVEDEAAVLRPQSAREGELRPGRHDLVAAPHEHEGAEAQRRCGLEGAVHEIHEPRHRGEAGLPDEQRIAGEGVQHLEIVRSPSAEALPRHLQARGEAGRHPQQDAVERVERRTTPYRGRAQDHARNRRRVGAGERDHRNRRPHALTEHEQRPVRKALSQVQKARAQIPGEPFGAGKAPAIGVFTEAPLVVGLDVNAAFREIAGEELERALVVVETVEREQDDLRRPLAPPDAGGKASRRTLEGRRKAVCGAGRQQHEGEQAAQEAGCRAQGCPPA